MSMAVGNPGVVVENYVEQSDYMYMYRKVTTAYLCCQESKVDYIACTLRYEYLLLYDYWHHLPRKKEERRVPSRLETPTEMFDIEHLTDTFAHRLCMRQPCMESWVSSL
jgi:hypothetical protein